MQDEKKTELTGMTCEEITKWVREAGMPCCFGIRVRDDRVCGVLYAVRARGGMIPPKGLTGYRYEQALDGAGYWVLRQEL